MCEKQGEKEESRKNCEELNSVQNRRWNSSRQSERKKS